MTYPRFAALSTGPVTHLDHLGVLCYILNIPLFVIEDNAYTAAQTFYPQVKTILMNASDLDAEFLTHHFDALFESGKFLASSLDSTLQLLYQKKMRFVYCPHGHSDKGHSAKQFVQQDVSLVYGKHMIDLLTQTGAIKFIKSMVRTGNYRLLFYLEHKPFYDQLVHSHVLQQKPLPHSKTILYAPSWEDGENPTSFFTSTVQLIQDLQDHFNLLIKLHPFLMEFHPAQTLSIVEIYKESPHVLFLDHFPCIYPLLEKSDLYIGDYSSIGYDFLAFNKPLYFFLNKENPTFAIHSCGLTIPPGGDIRKFIENTIEQNQREKERLRKTVYHYAFGEEKSFSLIRQEIFQSLL